jgi:hypothetical protein
VQYADDIILVMRAEVGQLFLLKELPQKVTLSNGFRVNFHKSCLVPINISKEHAAALATAYGCIVGSFPFTYIGLPLGLTKPLVKDYGPLICRVERRLSASSQFLSYDGGIQLVNSVIASLPNYYMCSLAWILVTYKTHAALYPCGW